MIPGPLAESYTEVDGVRTKVKDIEDRNLRALIGVGHSPGDIQTRERHPGFQVSPEDCLSEDSTGVWINDGQNLVCRDCGLDFT